MIKIKNIIQLTPHDDTNAIEMLYSIDDGSAKIVLDVRSDPTKNPTLIVGDQTISVTTNPFEYEIPSSLYVSSDGGVISFTVTDSEHEETPMFRIQKSLITVNSTMTVKAIDDRNFQIRVYQEAKSTAELTAEVNKIKNQLTFIERPPIGPDTITNANFFNDLPIGMYYVVGANTNYLPNAYGTLIHFRGEGNNYGCMILIGSNPQTFMYRPYSISNGSWYSGWITVDTVNDRNNILKTYYSLTTAIAIPSGANLNNYITPGNYYCSQNDTVATLSNCPTNGMAFTMKVEWANGTQNYIRQILTQYNYGYEFTRFYLTSQGWSRWLGTAPVKETHISNSCIYRVGNMVSWTTTAWQNLTAISIPVGYRPKTWNVWIPGTLYDSNHCTIYVSTEGVVRLFNNTMTEITGGRFLVNGSWATIDAMPA